MIFPRLFLNNQTTEPLFEMVAHLLRLVYPIRVLVLFFARYKDPCVTASLLMLLLQICNIFVVLKICV